MKSKNIVIVFLVLVFFKELPGQEISLRGNLEENSVEENDFEDSKFKSTTEKYIPITDPGKLQDSLRRLDQVTLNDLLSDTELETWEAPSKIRENFFKYYLSGYDDEDRPIWITELGKINLRNIFDGSQESIESMDKYCKQIALRFFKSFKNSSTTADQSELVHEIMYIADADGFDLRQMGHLPSLAFILRLLTQYRDLIINNLGGTTVINASAAMSIFTALVRPIFREALEKAEILGTNKERWVPILRSKFPLEALPPWYGGKSDYKPLAVF